MKKQRGLFVILLGVLLSWVGGAAAQTPGKSESDDTTKQLLQEVRALRQTLQVIQRLSLDTYRSQLLAERVRADREEVRRLAQSVNETQESISKTQKEIPQFEDQQKILESRLQRESDQGRRTEIEFEIRKFKDAIENYKADIEPLKEREQQFTNDFNTAKARLADLQNRLDSLERTIENDRQKLDNDSPRTKTP